MKSPGSKDVIKNKNKNNGNSNNKDTNNGSSNNKEPTNGSSNNKEPTNGSSECKDTKYEKGSRENIDNALDDRKTMCCIKIGPSDNNNKINNNDKNNNINNHNNNSIINHNNDNDTNTNINNDFDEPSKYQNTMKRQLINLYVTSFTSALFLAPIQVFFWWDVWCIVDYTFTPSNLTTLNPILSFSLLLTTIVLPQKVWRKLSKYLQTKWRCIHGVVRYIFNMAASVMVVAQWVGVWGALDKILGVVVYEEKVLGPGLIVWENTKEERHLWVHLVTSFLACVFFRVSCNLVVPVERGEVDKVDYFASPTRFKCPASCSLTFLYDCLFSYVVLAILQIHFWRSLWSIYDYYITPDNLISSRCMCVGVVLMVVVAKVLIKTKGIMKGYDGMRSGVTDWVRGLNGVGLKKEMVDGLVDRKMDGLVGLKMTKMDENDCRKSNLCRVELDMVGLKEEGGDGWKEWNNTKMDELRGLILDGGGLGRLVGGGVLRFQISQHEDKFTFKRWFHDVWTALHNSLTTILLWWSLWALFDSFADHFLSFHLSIIIRILFAIFSYSFLYFSGVSQFISRASFSLDGSDDDVDGSDDVIEPSGYS